jgi:hypothetical protein
MNFGIASQGTGNSTEPRKEQRRQFFMAAGGAALALMVAASLGAWQAREHAGGTTTGVGVSDGVQRDAAAGRQTEGGDSLAEWIAVQQRLGVQAGADTAGGVVYIVRSDEEARLLRQAFADADALRVAHGQRPAAAEVIATELPAATIELLPRAPHTTFIDLR